MSILTTRLARPSGDSRPPTNARPTDFSRRRLLAQIANTTTVMRQCSSLTAAAVALLDPAVPGASNTVLMMGLAVWAIYRLVTRSRSAIATAGDVVVLVVIGAAIPVLATPDEFFGMASVPQTVVAVSIATLGVQLPALWSATVLAVGICAYVSGASAVVGWGGALLFHDLLSIVFAWTVSVLLRLAIERVARTADQAHQDRLAAEVAAGVAQARRNSDREQLAMLHDTAAATLLLVGHTPHVPVERVAAQASRDLMVLQARPVTDHCAPVDVIRLLRDDSTYLDVPIYFTGLDHLWLDAEPAHALVAASREALNNVDRHADANSVTIYAGRHRLDITDDGRGISTGTSRGHGIDQSIVARMQRVGGRAFVHSAPGGGTTVELQWRSDDEELISAGSRDDDELERNLWSRYGLALTASNILVVTVGLWHALSANIQMPAVQIGLAVAVALCALSAPLTVRHGGRWVLPGVVATLTGIAIVQQATLSESELVYASWSQAAVGFCLLPHLLRSPFARGLAFLLTLWIIPAVIVLTRVPTVHMVLAFAVGAAAFLVPQIAAFSFITSVRTSLRLARRENATRLRLEARVGVAEAMASQRDRRYSDTVARLVPLLRTLSQRGPITEELRRHARAECRRLRALFDESGPESTLLSKRIQSLIGQAERRGVNVTAHVDGDLPTMSLDTAERVLHHIDAALDRASTWARIVLISAHAEVELSVVCDVASKRSPVRQPSGGAEVVVDKDTMWMTLRAG